ncbi:hypothetical protein [Nocardia sp.]|nr:hypothetical protein [Nocardia sp.]
MARSIWATLHGLSELVLRPTPEYFGLDQPPEDLAASTRTALLRL